MTLRELVAQYPALFRQDQMWWRGEAFADAQPVELVPFDFSVIDPAELGEPKACFSAAELANAYLDNPHDFKWRRWLWTTDVDAQGQRVFVGVEDGRFEIHRHLHLTHRWGVPL